MAPNSIIHLVRHAEGYHQLPLSHPDINLHDPELTPNGRKQCQRFRAQFTRHEQVDLLCASPMRRTLLTALLAFEPEVARGLKVVAVADAQEATDAPSDTGSPTSTLIKEFEDRVDYHNLSDDWYVKTGHNAVDHRSLFVRARALRQWIRERKEEEIVVVTHGYFAHFITGDVNEKGEQMGEYWNNVMERSFCFQDAKDEDAKFVETVESREKTAANEHIKHY